MKDRVIVVTGPTASGKTEMAVHIAKNIGGEIVSADSMQIYREMNIGTAKPTTDEMQGVPHHMMGEVNITSPYSVALYQQKALFHIRDILNRKKAPILAGGTGLYINSILYKLDFTETIKDDAYRAELNELPTKELYTRLVKLDPGAAARIHQNDKKRLIRRLEILKNGGSAAYDFREKNNTYDFLCIGLTMDRKDLYNRINARVDKMIHAGLVEEVKNIYAKHPDALIALKAIGYKEIIEYIDGRSTLEDAAEEIKKNTRRFAKRQLTWFNNDERITWFSYNDYSDPDELKNAVMHYVLRH